jgi:hypothetical protein
MDMPTRLIIMEVTMVLLVNGRIIDISMLMESRFLVLVCMEIMVQLFITRALGMLPKCLMVLILQLALQCQLWGLMDSYMGLSRSNILVLFISNLFLQVHSTFILLLLPYHREKCQRLRLLIRQQ